MKKILKTTWSIDALKFDAKAFSSHFYFYTIAYNTKKSIPVTSKYYIDYLPIPCPSQNIVYYIQWPHVCITRNFL